MSLRPAAFLDRDGVINVDRGYVFQQEHFEFIDGVFDGALKLQQLGFALVIVSNQSGIGRGFYSEADLQALNQWMRQQFEQRAVRIEGIYHCPHHPTEGIGDYRRECECRKPAAGMLLQAARELNLDLARSVMFGDRTSDLRAAESAGVPLRYLLGTDGLKRPEPAEPIGLSTGEFKDLREAASAVERQMLERAR